MRRSGASRARWGRPSSPTPPSHPATGVAARAPARAQCSAGRQQSRPTPPPSPSLAGTAPSGGRRQAPAVCPPPPTRQSVWAGRDAHCSRPPPHPTTEGVEVIRGRVARARPRAADERRRATATLAPTAPRRGGTGRTAGTEAVAGQTPTAASAPRRATAAEERESGKARAANPRRPTAVGGGGNGGGEGGGARQATANRAGHPLRTLVAAAAAVAHASIGHHPWAATWTDGTGRQPGVAAGRPAARSGPPRRPARAVASRAPRAADGSRRPVGQRPRREARSRGGRGWREEAVGRSQPRARGERAAAHAGGAGAANGRCLHCRAPAWPWGHWPRAAAEVWRASSPTMRMGWGPDERAWHTLDEAAELAAADGDGWEGGQVAAAQCRPPRDSVWRAARVGVRDTSGHDGGPFNFGDTPVCKSVGESLWQEREVDLCARRWNQGSRVMSEKDAGGHSMVAQDDRDFRHKWPVQKTFELRSPRVWAWPAIAGARTVL